MTLIAPALAIFGINLIVLAVLMLLPAALALAGDAPNCRVFLATAIFTALTGYLLKRLYSHSLHHFTTQKVFLVTAVNWTGISLFAALPFVFSSLQMSLTDAVFESVSGITTTGSTVLAQLDNTPRDILLWRSLSQWLGGIGIIAMAITILPFLQVGGMRLFKSESSDWSGKSTPRVRVQIGYLLKTYLVLTLLCLLSYWYTGMSFFEACNHAMTTISTGGYSIYDASIGHFHSTAILWVSVFFMVLGGMPFNLWIDSGINRRISIFRDEQVGAYLLILLLSGFGMAYYLYAKGLYGISDALMHGFLNTTSVMTTTGYASADFGVWGSAATAFFFFLIFLGGCSGSTSGGIKIFRFQIFWANLKKQMILSVHPAAIVTMKFNKREITEGIMSSSISFMYMAMFSYALLTMILALCGLDLVTSSTGALTALMNVGPGLGEIIGPAGNFASIPDAAKWALSFGMLLGRLEYLALYVLVTPFFWRG